MHKISSEDFLENCRKVGHYYTEIVGYILDKKNFSLPINCLNNEKYQEALVKLYEQTIGNPEKFTNLNLEYIHQIQKLMTESMQRFLGKSAQNEQHNRQEDRRFKDPSWQQNVYFDFIKQHYLITSEWIQQTVNRYELDEEGKNYIQFASRQFIDAFSPANFAFTNPVVIKESLETGFSNIAKGMENFLKDIKKSGDLLNISTTDKSYFKIGKDIAATKGKVIFQNDLIQLICYEPKEKTRSIPLLVVPPWINKYYILDLSPSNSLVKWLVDNNFQVFLISWVNPGKKHAKKDFEDYLKEGVITAHDELKKIGYNKINCLGYCIGGTLLACALSYLKNDRNNIINSASFLTTLIDFSNSGEVKVLINRHTFDIIAREVNKTGYLDGKYLSNSFSLVRANDLIWSFFINNYLLGKAPAAFDILYWNADGTNLPAGMYLYYIKNMYIENNLKKPGALEMKGRKINISEIDIPTFSVAAKSDHIAPWSAVYEGCRLLNGDKTFCLTEAGHVAGIVNPAGYSKYSFMIGKHTNLPKEKWLTDAKRISGSWWVCWKDWLLERSGELEKSIAYNKLNYIEDAPGRYVKK